MNTEWKKRLKIQVRMKLGRALNTMQNNFNIILKVKGNNFKVLSKNDTLERSLQQQNGIGIK